MGPVAQGRLGGLAGNGSPRRLSSNGWEPARAAGSGVFDVPAGKVTAWPSCHLPCPGKKGKQCRPGKVLREGSASEAFPRCRAAQAGAVSARLPLGLGRGERSWGGMSELHLTVT